MPVVSLQVTISVFGHITTMPSKILSPAFDYRPHFMPTLKAETFATLEDCALDGTLTLFVYLKQDFLVLVKHKLIFSFPLEC